MNDANGLAEAVSEPSHQNVLIIDDSSEYRAKEREIRQRIAAGDELKFYYTDYETRLIRVFHRTPLLGNFLAHALFWLTSMITALDILIRFRKERQKLFINPIVGLFYCAFSRVTGRPEQIGLAGLLFVHKRNTYYLNLRKKFTVFCCEKATLIFVYSHSELAEYSGMFPGLSSKLRFVCYGRDFDIFSVRAFQAEQPYIASGGVSNRDYRTLAKSLSILWDERCSVHCKIATRTGHAEIGHVPPNLEIRYDIRIDQFGSFLQGARFVLLPLTQTELSGGHMVLLEAMSRGKLVIVADTPGVRDYVNPACAIMYEPENAADLARAIRFALDKRNSVEIEKVARNGQATFFSTYTHAHLLERLMNSLVNREVTEAR